MKIWAHMLVKNEERYLWFSATSVIDYVDKILLWDTGSKDKTVDIARGLKKKYPEKIEFNQVGEVDIDEFTKVRNKMLKETKSDWFILVDGDEVWWDDTIKKLTDTIRKKGDKLDSIVTRYINLVGDIYHHQEDSAGRYKIDGGSGYLTIRAINRGIPGLNVSKPHGQQGFFDKEGRLIQERNKKKRLHIKDPGYLHFTNLIRSSSLKKDREVPKRDIKLKHEIGKSFPLDYYYPEAFFRERPEIVPSPWKSMDTDFYLKSLILTPPRRMKRKLISGPSGY